MATQRDRITWLFSGVLEDGSRVGWRMAFYLDTRRFQVKRTFHRDSHPDLIQTDMFPTARPNTDAGTLRELFKSRIPPAQLAAATAAAIRYSKGK